MSQGTYGCSPIKSQAEQVAPAWFLRDFDKRSSISESARRLAKTGRAVSNQLSGGGVSVNPLFGVNIITDEKYPVLLVPASFGFIK